MELKSYLKKKLNSISQFNRNILILFSGTTIAQAIPVAISPILTRLYTPEQFGEFAIYMSLAGFLSIFATLSYEHTLVLGKKKLEVDDLLMVCFFITLLISLFLFFVIFFFGETILVIFNLQEIGLLIYLIPFLVFLTGLNNSLNSRLIWKKNFKWVASNQIVLSSTNSFSKISFGILDSINQLGLIYANFISTIASSYYLFKKNFINISSFKNFTYSKFIKVTLRYKDFPLKNLPAAFLNSCYNRGKLIFIAIFFPISFIGLLDLVFRVLQMPISLVSSSISQVIFKNAAESFNQNNLNILKLRVLKIIIILSIVGAVPFLTLFIYGDIIFGFVFGKNWTIAGEYASIMSLGLYAMFIASPLTKVFWGLKKNHLHFCWELIRLFLVFFSITCIGYYGLDEYCLVWSLSLSIFASYVILVIMLISVLGNKE